MTATVLPLRRLCPYCPKRATQPDGCCGECTAELTVAMSRHPAGKGLEKK